MSGQAWAYLNPRSVSNVSERTSAATGPHVTPEDVKLALQGLKREPYRFGMAAFLRDQFSRNLLEGYALQVLRWQAEAGAWITKREHYELLERMAQLMVWECVEAQSKNDTLPGETPMPKGSAAVLCPVCHGRSTDLKGKICGTCGGSRRFVLDDARRAEAVGIHKSNWNRTWRERYAEAMQHPRRWEAIAISHVRRKLRPEGY